MGEVRLRPVEDGDHDALFEQMRDPESVHMAAFTTADPDDRARFDRWMHRVRSSPGTTMRTITCDDDLVGSIAAFDVNGRTEVTYWVRRDVWGRGIASRALRLLLAEVATRPILARVAVDNVRSMAVLAGAGFVWAETETSHAAGRGAMVDEHVMRLA